MTWPAVQTCEMWVSDLAICCLSSRDLGGCNCRSFSERIATYSVVFVTIDEHFPPPLPGHIRRDLLKFARRALTLNLHRIVRNLILEQPTRVLPPPQHKLRVRLLRLNDRFFDIIVNRRLNSTHEPRAHVDSLRSQAQRSSQTLAVREPAAGDERHRHSLASAREEDEVRDIALANMASAFEAVDREEIYAEFDRAQRVSDGRTLVQNDTGRVGFFQLLDDRARAVARGFYDADAFV
jgi:hypothetical protein